MLQSEVENPHGVLARAKRRESVKRRIHASHAMLCFRDIVHKSTRYKYRMH